MDDVFLERVFSYNLNGISIIEDNFEKNKSLKLNEIVLLSHFYSHAGDFARELAHRSYENNKKIEWLKEWCVNKKKSSDWLLKFEPKHATYTVGFAGTAADKLYNLTQDIEWLKKSYDANLKSAELSKSFDEKFSAHSYGFAGAAAYKLYHLTKDLTYAKKGADCFEFFLKYYQKNIPDEKNKETVNKIKRKKAVLDSKLNYFI